MPAQRVCYRRVCNCSPFAFPALVNKVFPAPPPSIESFISFFCLLKSGTSGDFVSLRWSYPIVLSVAAMEIDRSFQRIAQLAQQLQPVGRSLSDETLGESNFSLLANLPGINCFLGCRTNFLRRIDNRV